MVQAVSIFDIITHSVKAKEEVAVKRGLAGWCEERKSECQKWEVIDQTSVNASACWHVCMCLLQYTGRGSSRVGLVIDDMMEFAVNLNADFKLFWFRINLMSR